MAGKKDLGPRQMFGEKELGKTISAGKHFRILGTVEKETEKEIFKEILARELAHSRGGAKVPHQMRQTQAKGGRGEFPQRPRVKGQWVKRARPLTTAKATPWLKRRAKDRLRLHPDNPLNRTHPQPCRF
jgi:hypothetical protein